MRLLFLCLLGVALGAQEVTFRAKVPVVQAPVTVTVPRGIVDGLTAADFALAAGRDTLVNRKGTTWRQLDPAVQASLTDEASAHALMQQHASVIKRPVVEWSNGAVTVGFSPDDWAERG